MILCLVASGLEDAELARRVAEHRANRYVVLGARQGEPELPPALRRDLDDISEARAKGGAAGSDDDEDEGDGANAPNPFAALLGGGGDDEEEEEDEEGEEEN